MPGNRLIAKRYLQRVGVEAAQLFVGVSASIASI
jgi:hypothetical protein